MTLRILIVEDHALVSQGLELMLSTSADLEVVGVVSSAADAIHIVNDKDVDVVLMDVNLGRTKNGLEATRLVKAAAPETKVLVLTMYSDTETVSEAIRSGADGYLTKGSSRETLVRGILDVAEGKSVLDPNVTGGIFGRLSERDPHALSDRELTILQRVSLGQSTRQIAHEVGLAEETVKSHLKQIFKKLGVRDRTEAAAEGLRRQLIH